MAAESRPRPARQEILSMERYETMIRATRYLLGAGTIAAAMLAMTAGSTSAQTTACIIGPEGDPTFCGHVFTDVTAPGNTADQYDAGEEVPNVYVQIQDTSGTPVANSPTPTGVCPGENCGSYGFVVYDPPGTEYWICVITDPAKTDCSNTTDHPEGIKVVVGDPPYHDFEVGDDGSSEPPPSEFWGVRTGTPGYWKNHPEAWPAEGIVVGGVTYLNQTAPATAPLKTIYDAITLMGKVSGDKTVSMFAALISAKLNTTLANNTSCIAETIGEADI